MLIDKTNGHLDIVKKLAEEAGPQAVESLAEKLKYLNEYAQGRADAHVWKDALAPLSFYIKMIGKEEGTLWWDGGLIYSGPGLGDSAAQVLNGNAPTFVVAIDPKPVTEHHWTIHT